MSSSQKDNDYSAAAAAADKLNGEGDDGASHQFVENNAQEVINAPGGGMFEDQG